MKFLNYILHLSNNKVKHLFWELALQSSLKLFAGIDTEGST